MFGLTTESVSQGGEQAITIYEFATVDPSVHFVLLTISSI